MCRLDVSLFMRRKVTYWAKIWVHSATYFCWAVQTPWVKKTNKTRTLMEKTDRKIDHFDKGITGGLRQVLWEHTGKAPKQTRDFHDICSCCRYLLFQPWHCNIGLSNLVSDWYFTFLYLHWSLIPYALQLMKKSMQNLNDSLNTMNSGKMIDIKEKETCQHPSSQLFIIYTNRYRQDAARDHSKLHFPICCRLFSSSPFPEE